ncbi:UDP-glucose dehydrogenase family protein [Paenibacillus sacheonensis]|uniref:UDP-glucose 6-dehydrogenase n=1 Tax=Paenibacillus sacheonensis TaxID=742054 RepID=A0A7X4YP39_9BACL|nr:UDP-glucose/GDP-mannose dehydrogenase family protein [Paenibacillus sacheonensis]MBM7567336.1 UDPglucose 6-dehydrogenase [Paenibacillus sacheonensis]NBC69880.1 nucleotide sugar dehydrogenase [Paenibacillus sacheonensis]
MRIAVIGCGFVGLVTGASYAALSHEVICVDKDERKIARLLQGEIPIHEPVLQELVIRNMQTGTLSFTTHLEMAVRMSEIIILAVGTPSLADGETNLSDMEQAVGDIALCMNGPKTIITKTTVPVGTNHKLQSMLSSLTDEVSIVVSMPEFLREGSAIRDMLYPDRIVIGTDRPESVEDIIDLHRPLTSNIIITDIRSAEMMKYASNAFLATKISFINEIANVCEKVGADVTQVAEGMGYDHRIGPSCLQAGIGYGGSCFTNDTQALIQIAGSVNYESKLLKSVIDVNREQRRIIVQKLVQLFGQLQGRTIAVWGLAFKPNTDEIWNSPAIDVIRELIALGAAVRACDPLALPNFRKHYDHERVVWCKDALDAACEAEAICLLTDWPEFGGYDLARLQQVMKQPVLIDGRNMYKSSQLDRSDFIYFSIGRPALNRGLDQAKQGNVHS